MCVLLQVRVKNKMLPWVKHCENIFTQASYKLHGEQATCITRELRTLKNNVRELKENC